MKRVRCTLSMSEREKNFQSTQVIWKLPVPSSGDRQFPSFEYVWFVGKLSPLHDDDESHHETVYEAPVGADGGTHCVIMYDHPLLPSSS